MSTFKYFKIEFIMLYTLKSQRNKNQMMIIDLIIVVVGVVVFSNLILKDNKGSNIYILLIIILPFLLFLAQKRFLYEVVFDFDNQVVKTTSVISFVKKEYSFDEIQTIKMINLRGIGNTVSGFRNQNFVIRIKRNLQPQIYEVKNIYDQAVVNQIIEKSKSTFLKFDQ